MSPFETSGTNFWAMSGSRFMLEKKFVERDKVPVVRSQPEYPGASVAIQRLQDDIPVLFPKGAQRVEIARDCGGRCQVGKLENKQFLRIVPDPERIVYDQRGRRKSLEDMSCRDVAHVEWRVLTKPDDVEFGQVDLGFRTKREMISHLSAKCQWPAASGDATFLPGKTIRGVIEDFVSQRLCFFSDAKR